MSHDAAICGFLVALAAIGLPVAVRAVLLRMREARVSASIAFWWRLTEVYCRCWFRLKREGECTVPPRGPVVLVANHTCGVDPLLLIAGTPRRLISFMIAEEFANLPIARRFIRMIECVSVRRDGQDMTATKAALRHLQAGKALGIFIEGRIARPGETLGAKDGAAMLALRAGAVVVPVHISGTCYDENVAWSFLRRHRAVVRYGPPFDLREYRLRRTGREALGGISDMFLDGIRQLGPRPKGGSSPGASATLRDGRYPSDHPPAAATDRLSAGQAPRGTEVKPPP